MRTWYYSINLISFPFLDPSRDDGRVEQGSCGAASPRTEGGKTSAAGGEIQTSAVPEERYQTESRDCVFYRSRTICSVSIWKRCGVRGDGGFDCFPRTNISRFSCPTGVASNGNRRCGHL